MGHSDQTVLDRVRFLPHPATPTFTDILGSAGGRSSGRLVGVLTPGTHFDTSLSAGMTQLRRHPTQVSVVVAHSGLMPGVLYLSSTECASWWRLVNGARVSAGNLWEVGRDSPIPVVAFL